MRKKKKEENVMKKDCISPEVLKKDSIPGVCPGFEPVHPQLFKKTCKHCKGPIEKHETTVDSPSLPLTPTPSQKSTATNSTSPIPFTDLVTSSPSSKKQIKSKRTPKSGKKNKQSPKTKSPNNNGNKSQPNVRLSPKATPTTTTVIPSNSPNVNTSAISPVTTASSKNQTTNKKTIKIIKSPTPMNSNSKPNTPTTSVTTTATTATTTPIPTTSITTPSSNSKGIGKQQNIATPTIPITSGGTPNTGSSKKDTSSRLSPQTLDPSTSNKKQGKYISPPSKSLSPSLPPPTKLFEEEDDDGINIDSNIYEIDDVDISMMADIADDDDLNSSISSNYSTRGSGSKKLEVEVVRNNNRLGNNNQENNRKETEKRDREILERREKEKNQVDILNKELESKGASSPEIGCIFEPVHPQFFRSKCKRCGKDISMHGGLRPSLPTPETPATPIQIHSFIASPSTPLVPLPMAPLNSNTKTKPEKGANRTESMKMHWEEKNLQSSITNTLLSPPRTSATTQSSLTSPLPRDPSTSSPTLYNTPVPKSSIPPSSSGTKFGGGSVLCSVCNTRAYPLELQVYNGQNFHKACFKCLSCKREVALSSVAMMEGNLYCKNCFMRQFKTRGSYTFDKHTSPS